MVHNIHMQQLCSPGNSGETYELVKGTAYAIAASAHAAADKTSKQK